MRLKRMGQKEPTSSLPYSIFVVAFESVKCLLLKLYSLYFLFLFLFGFGLMMKPVRILSIFLVFSERDPTLFYAIHNI
jgi:hypothetical protein